MKYEQYSNKRETPQSEQARPDQVENSAGGYTFQVDDFERLRRFLILGSEGGTYYIGQKQLTKENVGCVERCWAQNPGETAKIIADVSHRGRAPKNDPALFALAIGAGMGPDQRKAALEVLPQVARIGTHYFTFARMVETQRGWGRGLRRAVANWYETLPLSRLAYQLVKYQQRDGWSHRDLLRLSHPKAESAIRKSLLNYATKGELLPVNGQREIVGIIEAVIEVQSNPGAQRTAELIRAWNLPREVVPTELLNDNKVWDALLENMPITATLRNLATMTAKGVLAPMSSSTNLVANRLTNEATLHGGRVHPLSILQAMGAYAQGHGIRGSQTWTPIREIVDALDTAFYASFVGLPKLGLRVVLGIDISRSMYQVISGMPGVTCRQAATAMAMVAIHQDPKAFVTLVFDCKSRQWEGTGVREVALSKKLRMDGVIHSFGHWSGGGTDCSLPMLHALEKGYEADAFVVYTDNETWHGKVHPHQALEKYRQKTGIPAKLVVVGMASNGFTIADPKDPGMLDVVGFDTTVPNVMEEFFLPNGPEA